MSKFELVTKVATWEGEGATPSDRKGGKVVVKAGVKATYISEFRISTNFLLHTYIVKAAQNDFLGKNVGGDST